MCEIRAPVHTDLLVIRKMYVLWTTVKKSLYQGLIWKIGGILGGAVFLKSYFYSVGISIKKCFR